MQRDTACKRLPMKMMETKRKTNLFIILSLLMAFLFAMTGCSTAKTAPEVFQSLCEVPEAAFEKKWNAAMKTVESKGLTDDWNQLTSTASAYMDYLDAPDLMEVCDPSDPKHPKTSSPFFEEIQRSVEKGLTPWLKDAIYTPGQHLELSGTVWLPAKLEAFAEGRGHMDRTPGDPIRVLVIDGSQKIATRDSGIMDMYWLNGNLRNKLHDDISDRARSVWSGLVGEAVGDAVFWTAYPELADVLLTIDVSYPAAGHYSGSATQASVFGCKLVVTAENAVTGESISRSFSNMPGSNTKAPIGSTIVWMELPDLRQDTKAAAFVQQLLSWFPDAQPVG